MLHFSTGLVFGLSALSIFTACVSVDARSQQAVPSASPVVTQVSSTPLPASLPTSVATAAAASPVLLPARFGEVALLVELARSDQEQQKGLMFRKTMPADQGMLFVFEKEQRLGFWMKNTYLPLSIAFLNSEFEIVDIQDMMPLDENTHVSLSPALYALEMNQGWFRQHKIEVGAKLEIRLPAEPS
jgi:uncharacterized membrane protein (UPF0127 family)